jgi:cystathionine beta-lyase
MKERVGNKAKLWLDHGDIFGEGGELFERINIACPRSILEQAMNRLKEAFK